MSGTINRPGGVTVIAIVNSFAVALTFLFWGFVFLRMFAVAGPPRAMDTGSMATTFGFMVGDLIWAELALIISVIGLWRLRAWGWLAAQMVNILWLYSMTVIWCRDLYAGSFSPGGILFLPFVPFSVWASRYLWIIRERFWRRNNTKKVEETQYD